MVFQESKILKFLGLCGIHSREPGSVVFLSAIEIRGGASWPEENLRRREPVRSGSEGNEMVSVAFSSRRIVNQRRRKRERFVDRRIWGLRGELHRRGRRERSRRS